MTDSCNWYYIYAGGNSVQIVLLIVEKLPGPSDYRPYRDHYIPGGVVGKASKTPTSYPDCLQYKRHLKTTKAVPGVGAYHSDNHCISKNTAPKYTFRGATKKDAGGKRRVEPLKIWLWKIINITITTLIAFYCERILKWQIINLRQVRKVCTIFCSKCSNDNF